MTTRIIDSHNPESNLDMPHEDARLSEAFAGPVDHQIHKVIFNTAISGPFDSRLISGLNKLYK